MLIAKLKQCSAEALRINLNMHFQDLSGNGVEDGGKAARRTAGERGVTQFIFWSVCGSLAAPAEWFVLSGMLFN